MLVYQRVCFLGMVGKLGSHHPSSAVCFLEHRPFRFKKANCNKLIYMSKTSFISGKSRVGEVSFNQILVVQSIPQTCCLGKPLHTLFYLSLPRCFWHVSKQTSRVFRCFFCQESADRDKVIPEKRKKLYGVRESEGVEIASQGGYPATSHAPCMDYLPTCFSWTMATWTPALVLLWYLLRRCWSVPKTHSQTEGNSEHKGRGNGLVNIPYKHLGDGVKMGRT